MASKIEQLASEISPSIPGVPWGEISRLWGMSPQEIVTDTQPPADGQTPMGIQQYQHAMDQAYLRAKAAIDTIDMPWDIGTEEAMRAWNDVRDRTLDVSNSALVALKQSFYSVLPDSVSLDVHVEEFRAIVASTYMTALYGFVLHRRMAFQKFDVSANTIIEHAEEVTKAFNLLDMWFRDGVLGPLQRKGPAPVGAIQIPVVVGAVVAITAVAIVAALAWTMVANKKISATNRAMDLLCKRAVETKDESLLAACKEMSEQNQVALESGPSNFGPDSIVRWITWGVVAYLAVTVLPPAFRAWEAGNKRRALREISR